MNSLVFLIPLSIVLLVGAGVALFWAVDHGQFEDLESPGLLPVFDADDRKDDAGPGDTQVTGRNERKPLP